MNLPYALQLAHGWTRLAFFQNVLSVFIVVPAIWWLGSHYGGPGAATVWVALNLGYVLISVPLLHRRLMRGEMSHWYLRDVLPPALTAIATAGAIRLFLPAIPGGLPGIIALAAIGIVTLFCSALASSAARTQAKHLLRERFG